MDQQVLTGLIYNTAIILALGLVIDMTILSTVGKQKFNNILIGIILGFMGIVVINASWEFSPGFIYDTRSIILSIGGMFFGFIPSVIAVVMTGLARFFHGGDGFIPGLMVILLSSGIGILIRKLKKNAELSKFTTGDLLMLGILVHTAMLLVQLLMIPDKGLEIVKSIWFPVMTLFPLGTVILGKLLINREISRNAQDEIAVSEQNFRTLADVAPTAISIISKDGNKYIFSYVNKLWSEFTGYSIDDMNKKNLFDIVHPDMHGEVLSKKLLDTDIDIESRGHNTKIITKSGEVRWLNYGINRFEYRGRSSVITVAVDVTEQRAAEQAIQENEIIFKSFLEHSPVYIFFKDDETRALRLSSNYREMLGMPVENALGKTMDELFPSDLSKSMVADDKKILETGVLNSIVEEMDGKYYETTKFPISLSNDVKMLAGFTVDITKRRSAEIKLTREKRIIDLFVKIYSELNDLSDKEIYDQVLEEVVSNTDSKIGFMHKVDTDQNTVHLCSWYKKTLEECAMPAESHYNIADSGSWTDCIKTKKPIIYNDFSDSPNQKGFPVRHMKINRFMSIPVLSEGKVKLVFGVGNKSGDYSEQDSSNLELVANELMKVIKQRQVEIEREQALVEVRNANKVKDLFIANMSHEIRTPMNTILGFSQILEEELDGKLSEDQQKYFDVLKSGGQRLMNTVHGILDMSQIEAGTFEHNPGNFDLAVIINQCVAEFSPVAQGKNVGLEFKNSVDKPVILGDSASIYRALANLLDNAVKYTKEGDVTLSLKAENNQYILTIQDTGVGIGADYLDHMFDAFSQESTGYTKKYQGLGLGLAVVKRCLDLDQVEIAVVSTVGEGTIFSLFFEPVSSNGKSGNTTKPRQDKKSHPKSAKKQQPAILIVEDDINSQRTLSVILGKSFEIFVAKSVVEAKQQLMDADIDLIILDLSLEGNEDGIDLMKYLRNQEQFLYLPVIAVTAHAFTSDRDNALEAGCNEFITKPIKIDNLISVVTQYLKPVITDQVTQVL